VRASRRRRPPSRIITDVPSGVDLVSVAERARYVGSPEHKDMPSFAGHPRPRADATICDRAFADKLPQINNWLRLALTKGVVGAPWEGNFPRYAWFKDGDVVYEARLVNSGTGEYKGYALEPDEWPRGIDRYYEHTDCV